MPRRPLDKRLLAAAAAVVVAAAVIYWGYSGTAAPAPDRGALYSEMNADLKRILEGRGIAMSSPVRLGEPADIIQYCSFFEGEEQRMVRYCTSTELRDAGGAFLGNVHMVGEPGEPRLLMAVLQMDPFLNQMPDAKRVFSAVVDGTICDCWDSRIIQDSTLDAISDRHAEFHTGGDQVTSRSSTIPLDGRLLQFEMTTNMDGYLWKLLVTL